MIVLTAVIPQSAAVNDTLNARKKCVVSSAGHRYTQRSDLGKEIPFEAKGYIPKQQPVKRRVADDNAGAAQIGILPEIKKRREEVRELYQRHWSIWCGEGFQNLVFAGHMRCTRVFAEPSIANASSAIRVNVE